MLYCDSRVERLLRGGGEMVLGGDTDRDDLYIAPTILIDVTNDDAVMQEEVHMCINISYLYLFHFIPTYLV